VTKDPLTGSIPPENPNPTLASRSNSLPSYFLLFAIRKLGRETSQLPAWMAGRKEGNKRKENRKEECSEGIGLRKMRIRRIEMSQNL